MKKITTVTKIKKIESEIAQKNTCEINEKSKPIFFFNRKVILCAILPVFLIATLFCFAICRICTNASQNEMKSLLTEISTYYASSIENKIKFYLNTERHYNIILNNFNFVPLQSRRLYYVNLSKKFLDNNISILSYWFDTDANKLDGLDEQYRNHKYFNDGGRFSACWYREALGNYAYAKDSLAYDLEEVATADYMRLPRDLKRTVVIDPYWYSYYYPDSTMLLMTSIVSPIFAGGSKDIYINNDDNNINSSDNSSSNYSNNRDVIGNSGIDISLDTIINLVQNMNLFAAQYATLLSSEGNFLSHPDPELIKTNLATNLEKQSLNADSIMKLINNSENVQLDFVDKTDKQRKLIYIVPIKFKDSATLLNLELVFHYDVIMADSQRLTSDIIMYFSIAFFITVLIILITSALLNNSIVK